MDINNMCLLKGMISLKKDRFELKAIYNDIFYYRREMLLL